MRSLRVVTADTHDLWSLWELGHGGKHSLSDEGHSEGVWTLYEASMAFGAGME